MPRTRRISKSPAHDIEPASLPAMAFVGPTPHGSYKTCFNEQTTIAGKKSCYKEYRLEKSEDQ